MCQHLMFEIHTKVYIALQGTNLPSVPSRSVSQLGKSPLNCFQTLTFLFISVFIAELPCKRNYMVPLRIEMYLCLLFK